MIVFDLRCSASHIFEAWFGSSQDYEDQNSRNLIACPVCGDADIVKAVMAPAVAAKSNQRSGAALPVQNQIQEAEQAAKMRALLTEMAKAQGEALKNSEWVGREFADVARAMHYGEQDHKTIHGEVAPQEARSLMEEGVEVAPLLLPVVPPAIRN